MQRVTSLKSAFALPPFFSAWFLNSGKWSPAPSPGRSGQGNINTYSSRENMKSTPVGSHRSDEAREVAREWEELAVRLNHGLLIDFAGELQQATSLEQLDQLWLNLRSESRRARQRRHFELRNLLQACAQQVEDVIRFPLGAPEPLPVDARYQNFVLQLARKNLEACRSWITKVRRKRYRDLDENGHPFSDVTPLEDVVLTEVLRILQDVRASGLP